MGVGHGRLELLVGQAGQRLVGAEAVPFVFEE
jgi:hypothetical protein